MYHHNIFYKVEDLSLEVKIKIIEKAKELSFEWKVNILDGFQRKAINMDFKEIMTYFDESSHFVVINRKGYDDWKDKEWFRHNWCGEVGFRTMGFPDYFLFVWLSEENLEILINEFGLKPMK